jgi:hypothetical protein
VIVFGRDPDGRRQISSVGGGCFTMLLVSVVASILLTVLLNVLL